MINIVSVTNFAQIIQGSSSKDIILEYEAELSEVGEDIVLDDETNVEKHKENTTADYSKWTPAISMSYTLSKDYIDMKPPQIIGYDKGGYTGNLILDGEPTVEEIEPKPEDQNVYELKLYNTLTTSFQMNVEHDVEYVITDGLDETAKELTRNKVPVGTPIDTQTIKITIDTGEELTFMKVDGTGHLVDESNEDENTVTKNTRVYSALYRAEIPVDPNQEVVKKYHAVYKGTLVKPAEGTIAYTVSYKEIAIESEKLKQLNGIADKTVVQAADPVNIVSGSFYHNEQDFNVATIGDALRVTRHYNSRNYESSMFGNGWTSNWDYSLIVKPDSNILVKYGSGGQITFNKTNETPTEITYKAPQANSDVVKKTALKYVLNKKSGEILEFDLNGGLTKMLDKYGNAISITYNASEIDKISSDSGEYLKFTYSNDYVTKITDHAGRSYSYAYNGDKLVSVTTPLGGTRDYVYDKHGLTKLIDEMGQTYLINHYDALERVEWQEDGEGNKTRLRYNLLQKKNEIIDIKTGEITVFEFDESLRVTKKTFPDGTFEQYKFDSNSNKTEIRDRKGQITKFVYDSDNNLTELTQPDGTVIKNEYNDSDMLLKQYRNNMLLMEYAYNSLDKLTSMKQHIDVSTVAETTFTYDTKGRLIQKTTPGGNEVTYEYEGDSVPVKVTYPENLVKTYEYDNLSRMISETVDGVKISYEYDNSGNLIKITDPYNNITRNKYDIAGKLIETIAPKEYNLQNDSGKGTKFEYDFNDNITKITDPLGNIQAMKYDLQGNMVEVFDPNSFDNNKFNGESTKMTYDSDNNLIQVEKANGYKNKFSYDVLGNQLKSIDFENYNSATDNGSGNVYEYDLANRIIKITNANGEVSKRIEYDALGNPEKVYDGKGSATLSKFNYAGWLLEQRVPKQLESGEVRYSIKKYDYDIEGRIVKEYTTSEYVTETGTPSSWDVISYTYDKLGRVTNITDTGGSELINTYNKLGKKSSEQYKIGEDKYFTNYFEYDKKGRLIKSWNNALKADLMLSGDGSTEIATLYDYNENDQLVKKTLPSGHELNYEYDAAGRLTREYQNVEKSTVDIYNTNLSLLAGKERYAPGQKINTELKVVPHSTVDGFDVKVLYDIRFLDFEGLENAVSGVSVKNQGVGYIELTASGLDVSADTVLANLVFNAKQEKVGQTNVMIDPSSVYTSSSEAKSFYFVKGDTFDINGPDINLDGFVKADDLAIIARKNGLISTLNTYDPELDLNEDKAIGTQDLDIVKDWMLTADDKVFVASGMINFTESHVTPQYNINSQIVETEVLYEYDKAGNLTRVTDALGNTLDRNYNSNGQLISVTDAEGREVSFEYDKNDQLVKQIQSSSKGNVTLNEYKYDTVGRIVNVLDGKGITVEKRGYDLNNNIVSTTDALGNTTEYNYDLGNRLVSIITPEFSKASVSMTYNAKDFVVMKTAGESTTTFELDSWGKVLKEINALNETTVYEYDLMGNITKVIDPKEGEVDYSYNSLLLLASRIDQLDKTEQYYYNNMSQMTEKIEKDGTRIGLSYSKSGGMKEMIDRSSGETRQWLYNELGQQTGLVGKYGITTYSLNKLGERIAIYEDGVKSTDMSYNDYGLLDSISTLGQTVSYDYDENQRLNRVSEGGKTKAVYAYTNAGLVDKVSYSNGLVSDFAYNKNMQVSTETHTLGGNTIQASSYTYDILGNVLSKTVNGDVTSYTYDPLSRVKTVSAPKGVTDTYSYDSLGNRTLVDNGTDQSVYAYNKTNQLVRLSAPHGVHDYVYDGRGNLVKETFKEAKGDVVTDYAYNGFDQLVSVRNPNGYQINRFNAEGKRASVLYNGRETNKVYMGSQLVGEFDNKGLATANYTRGLGLVSIKQRYEDEAYYVSNYRQDTLKLVDIAGLVKNEYAYDLFGNVQSEIETLNNPFKYAGYEQDKLLNDYYLNARIYRPSIGRFIQEDNYLGDGLNLYAYVANNPMRFVDHTGYAKVVAGDGSGTEGNVEDITSRGFEDVVASPENFTSVIIAGNEVTWDAIAVYGESVIEGIKKMDGRSSLWGRQQKQLMNETVGGITSKVSAIGTFYDMVAPAAVDTYNNYVNDAEVSEYVADIGVDLAISTAVVVSSAKLGAQARAQYDGPKGALAGAVTGAGVGIVGLWAVDTVEGVFETGETVRETLQDGAKMLYEKFIK